MVPRDQWAHSVVMKNDSLSYTTTYAQIKLVKQQNHSTLISSESPFSCFSIADPPCIHHLSLYLSKIYHIHMPVKRIFWSFAAKGSIELGTSGLTKS